CERRAISSVCAKKSSAVTRIVVSRVEIAGMPAYLKREHRVPWRERLRNLWSGFGLASKSWREAQLLRDFSSRFDGCPEWIAAAELPDGQSFVLVREVSGGVPLPRLLDEMRDDTDGRRRL